MRWCCRSGDGGGLRVGAPRDRALRSQGSSGEAGLSRCARGMRVIASSARSGPIPLPLGTRPSIGVWMDVVSGPS
jgi:hypothetical protein